MNRGKKVSKQVFAEFRWACTKKQFISKIIYLKTRLYSIVQVG